MSRVRRPVEDRKIVLSKKVHKPDMTLLEGQLMEFNRGHIGWSKDFILVTLSVQVVLVVGVPMADALLLTRPVYWSLSH